MVKSPRFFSDGREIKENGLDHTKNDLNYEDGKITRFPKWVSLRAGDDRRTDSYEILTRICWNEEIASLRSQWHLRIILRETLAAKANQTQLSLLQV